MPLFRMGLAPQQVLDRRAGVGTDGRAPVDEPRGRPFGVRPMRSRHVLRQRRMHAALVGAYVARHPDTAVEHLDRGRAEARPELLTDQRVRYAVIVPL